jgi:hypothetical protein
VLWWRICLARTVGPSSLRRIGCPSPPAQLFGGWAWHWTWSSASPSAFLTHILSCSLPGPAQAWNVGLDHGPPVYTSCVVGMSGTWHHTQLLLLEMGLILFALAWHQNILLISASWVARITGVGQCSLALLSFLERVSLCSLGWPWTHYSSSAFQVARIIGVVAPHPGLTNIFKDWNTYTLESLWVCGWFMVGVQSVIIG